MIRFNLGASRWQLRAAPRGELGEDHDGHCDLAKDEILVADDITAPADALDVHLHELLHAVWGTRRLQDEEAEEVAVAALAGGLAEAIARSPLLADHLVALIRATRAKTPRLAPGSRQGARKAVRGRVTRVKRQRRLRVR